MKIAASLASGFRSEAEGLDEEDGSPDEGGGLEDEARGSLAAFLRRMSSRCASACFSAFLSAR